MISNTYDMSFPIFGIPTMQRVIGSSIRVKLSTAYIGAANGTNDTFTSQLLTLYASINKGTKLVEELINNVVIYATLTGLAKLEQVKKAMILVRRISDIVAARPEYIAAFQAIFPSDA